MTLKINNAIGRREGEEREKRGRREGEEREKRGRREGEGREKGGKKKGKAMRGEDEKETCCCKILLDHTALQFS